MLHHQLANDITLHLLSAQTIQLLLNLFDGIFNFANRQWTLLARFADTYIEFLPIKIFSTLVALNHHQVKFLHPLVGAESPLTLLAFAPAMNSITNITRIFDSRFSAATQWTFHDEYPVRIC